MPSLDTLVSYFDENVGSAPYYLADKWKGKTTEDSFQWVFRGYRKVQ